MYAIRSYYVLLPETNINGAWKTAEKIRTCVENEQFSDVGYPVTVSIGIATIHQQHLERGDELMNLADKALYKAKENGRNRIEKAESLA